MDGKKSTEINSEFSELSRTPSDYNLDELKNCQSNSQSNSSNSPKPNNKHSIKTVS